jgi:hyperosmotically inducible protein
MRYIRTVIISTFLLAATALAQITALPENRQKLGGTDPSARIAREVMHELLMDPYYSVFDNLAFKVEGNTVTLYGQVVNPVVKSDAETSVRDIEGVQKVVDNIEVLPLSPNDNRIRHEVYRAVYGFDGLSRYSWGAVPSIHFIVKNGHVTLTGVVDNETDKNMAGLRANTVPGVFSVKNDLQVEATTAEKQPPSVKTEKK